MGAKSALRDALDSGNEEEVIGEVEKGYRKDPWFLRDLIEAMVFSDVDEFVSNDTEKFTKKLTMVQINNARENFKDAGILQSYVLGRLSDIGDIDIFLVEWVENVSDDAGNILYNDEEGLLYCPFFEWADKSPSLETLRAILQSSLRRNATEDLQQIHRLLEGVEEQDPKEQWMVDLLANDELEEWRRITDVEV